MTTTTNNRFIDNVISEIGFSYEKMKKETGKRDLEGFLSPHQNGLFFDFVNAKKRFIDRSEMLVKRGKIQVSHVEYVNEYFLKLITDLNENYQWTIKVYNH